MPQHKEDEGGIRIAVDPKSTVCERIGQIIEEAEKQGKISGQDHGFITAHMTECDKCRKSWGDRFSELKHDISS